MTPFFIPGLNDNAPAAERAYADMRTHLARELGHQPNARRIVQLWTRRGRTDCITEVGKRDPLRGGTVLAIFDMGVRQPFVVWWQPDGVTDAAQEILSSSAYSVLEFDR